MTVTDYLRVLRRQWFLVLLLAVLAVAGAATYTFTATPTYSASTRLFVSVSGEDASASDLQSGSSFTQQRVKSYTNLVDSPEVLKKVISQLGLHYTVDQLAEKITAESPLDTVLLNVTVKDTNPRQAASIANAFAANFAPYVADIETPSQRTSAISPVKLSVTRAADVPSDPISPRVPLNLALGLLLGIALGVGLAVLRDQLNTSVSGIGDVEKITGQIPLGVVPFDRSTGANPLVKVDDQGGRAEAFRTLRTNLQFTNVDDPPRVIVITSALPNEGKSVTASNIAMTLALSGASVILVEGDLRKPSLGKYLGISSAAGLTNVLAGHYELRDVIVSYNHENLAVLPSGPKPPNPSELLGSAHMSNLLATLRNHFDYVFVDAPPLLPVTDAAVIAAMADGAVLVVRSGKTKRENLSRAIQSLNAVNAKVLGTVLNFAPIKRRSGYDGYGYRYGSPADSGRGIDATFRNAPNTPSGGTESLDGWSNASTRGPLSDERFNETPFPEGHHNAGTGSGRGQPSQGAPGKRSKGLRRPSH